WKSRVGKGETAANRLRGFLPRGGRTGGWSGRVLASGGRRDRRGRPAGMGGGGGSARQAGLPPRRTCGTSRGWARDPLHPRAGLGDGEGLLPEEDDESGGRPPRLAHVLGEGVVDLGPGGAAALREVDGEGGRVEERLEGSALPLRDPDDDVG